MADIEEDSIGLLALAGAEIVLYRFKPFSGEAGGHVSVETRLEQAATEIENTLHFLEDHEGRRDETVHVRCLIGPAAGEALEFLRRRLSAPVVPVACPVNAGRLRRRQDRLRAALGAPVMNGPVKLAVNLATRPKRNRRFFFATAGAALLLLALLTGWLGLGSFVRPGKLRPRPPPRRPASKRRGAGRTSLRAARRDRDPAAQGPAQGQGGDRRTRP